jgi:hypothetical protein
VDPLEVGIFHQGRRPVAKRNYKPEKIISNLRQADALIAQGTESPDVVPRSA